MDRSALHFGCPAVEACIALSAQLLQNSPDRVTELYLSRRDPPDAPDEDTSSVFYLYRQTNEKEPVMKITGFIITLTAATALAALAQEGTLEDVKHGAKKAGETVKNGVETAGKKTKEAAETVGEKTKETAETVGRKTKETAQNIGGKTKETTRTTHRKSRKTSSKAKNDTSEQQSTNQTNTPSPTDR
jgi:hypothetical protein